MEEGGGGGGRNTSSPGATPVKKPGAYRVKARWILISATVFIPKSIGLFGPDKALG